MKLFYTRTEYEREVVITYTPYFTWLFALAIPVWAFAGTQADTSLARLAASLLWVVVLVVLLWRAFAMRTVWREIRTAMRKGGVVMQGSKFNPRNPLTFSIPK